MAKVKKIENIEKASNVFMKLLENFKKNWAWWIAISAFAFIVALLFSFIRLINSDKIFERYDEYVEQKHQMSNEYRIESVPVITAYLNGLAAETKADKAYVCEFHNGKNNPTGLQWQYVDMTFINDEAEDVRDEFQNVSTVKYSLSYVLYENGVFFGTLEDVDRLDHRLALRLEANDIKYVAAFMMYGKNAREIGFIGLSYVEKPDTDMKELRKVLSRYAVMVTPYLDLANASEK